MIEKSLMTSCTRKNRWNSPSNQHRMDTQSSLFGGGYEKNEKKRVVIDIRGFNKITVTNFYFMPLQTDIKFAMAGC